MYTMYNANNYFRKHSNTNRHFGPKVLKVRGQYQRLIAKNVELKKTMQHTV